MTCPYCGGKATSEIDNTPLCRGHAETYLAALAGAEALNRAVVADEEQTRWESAEIPSEDPSLLVWTKTEPDYQDRLSRVWRTLTSEIIPLLDEDGDNVAGGLIRRLDGGLWLYVDDVDGFSILANEEAQRLLNSQVRLGGR